MHSTVSSISKDIVVAPASLSGELGARLMLWKAQWKLLVAGLVINDVILVGLAFLLAYVIRFSNLIPVFQQDALSSISFYQGLSRLLIPAWMVIFAALGLYQRKNLLGGTQEYALVFRASSVGMLLIVVAGFLDPELLLARGWILLAWILSFLMVSFGRFCIRRVVYSLRKRGYFLSPALIVGANQEGRALAQQLLGWRTSGLNVLGFVDDRLPAGDRVLEHLRAIGGLDQLNQFIEKYHIEEVILASSALSREEITSVFQRYGMDNSINLRLSSGLFEIITTGLEVKEIAYTPLVNIQKVRLTGINRILKFCLDYLVTIPGLIAITPLLLVIAIAIKLDSPGPVFYRRRVMGLNGRQFDAFKFRTMHMNGDEILDAHPELRKELEATYKLKHDPRITRMGSFLRKASVDELPQLLNVLKRDMSLVGPRIISPNEMPMYQEWGMNLLTVLPGITGLWQVSGRSDISYGERVRLDMQYIRNWTIWLDLQLLFQTIPAVIKQRGAY
jgi:exopolysaccharide biosynthesis polyprenyl glycosylphosphotransferase